MDFISVERNMRGFFYTRTWNQIQSFWKAMQHNIDEENNEIEWALLFDSDGIQAAKYNRGREIPNLD